MKRLRLIIILVIFISAFVFVIARSTSILNRFLAEFTPPSAELGMAKGKQEQSDTAGQIQNAALNIADICQTKGDKNTCYQQELSNLAKELIEQETLSAEEIDSAISGQ